MDARSIYILQLLLTTAVCVIQREEIEPASINKHEYSTFVFFFLLTQERF